MVAKDSIFALKPNGKSPPFAPKRKKKRDGKEILALLRNLGRISGDFDAAWVVDCLSSESKNIRLWSAKTLGKLESPEYLDILRQTARLDPSSEVRREAVSAIGRMRSPLAIGVLGEALKDEDPKIVCQAIRGLLVFKSDPRVRKSLVSLARHENEMVKEIIQKEYAAPSAAVPKQPHPASDDDLKNVVVLGDVLRVLEHVPEESFHLTFTSPPYYNARDYSVYSSYQAYLGFLEKVFQSVHQKTKEGRFLILNTSPVIVPRISRQHSSRRYPIPFDIHPLLVKMGWDFIDDIVWAKPESSVKNRNAGFLQHRKPLGYKPNPRTEYLMVYRKRTEKLIDWNIRQYDWRTIKDSKVADGYETSNVWEIDPTHDRVHSAVFPAALCRRVVEYYSYKGDLLFDPFGGSGTFGRTAKSLDRYFFLTEKNESYFDYMQSFLRKGLPFSERETRFLSLKEFAARKKGHGKT